MRKLAALLALAAPLSAQAAETGEVIRFLACPIYRDTDAGRKSGCWLADDRASGRRFDVTQSPHKPDWNREVLVEGRLAGTGGDPCGGEVLDPVRTSVLETPCPRHMLPAESYPGRRFVLPRRNNDPLGVARPAVPGPFTARTFPVYFEFDRAFIVYQYSDWLIDRAATWLRAARPRRVVVTGFAATRPETVSGLSLAERAAVADERAQMVAETLRRLIPELTVVTRTSLAAAPSDEPEADGLPGQSQRRAEISAEF